MHVEKASVKIQHTHMIFSETRTKREIFQSDETHARKTYS